MLTVQDFIKYDEEVKKWLEDIECWDTSWEKSILEADNFIPHFLQVEIKDTIRLANDEIALIRKIFKHGGIPVQNNRWETDDISFTEDCISAHLVELSLVGCSNGSLVFTSLGWKVLPILYCLTK